MNPPPLSKRIFDKYDKDHSGHIDIEEFASLCYELGHFLSEEEKSLAIQKLDVDGSGTISYKEFEPWWKNGDRFAKLQLSQDELETLRTATNYFKYFDSDKSGVLDRSEFSKLYEDMKKHNIISIPLEDCLKDLDNDNNGKISFNEYVDFLIRKNCLKVKVIYENVKRN
eukprot:TRINITY_DN2980_c0_g1_i1.p1 TRINITY_DN2980_c0_g1~~TRINITY_DN2980_c0_g1_i1.p1  ORF type:complete len:169 (-),score=53.12 TRINITY_DN2980_c0_g1_i1:70-576(-)